MSDLRRAFSVSQCGIFCEEMIEFMVSYTCTHCQVSWRTVLLRITKRRVADLLEAFPPIPLCTIQ